MCFLQSQCEERKHIDTICLNTQMKIRALANQYQGLWLPSGLLIDCILFFFPGLTLQVVGYLLVCPDKTHSWIPWPQAFRVKGEGRRPQQVYFNINLTVLVNVYAGNLFYCKNQEMDLFVFFPPSWSQPLLHTHTSACQLLTVSQ